jgi:hypothetical protein
MKGSDYCWIHSPEVSERVKSNARLLGGINRNVHMTVQFPDIVIKDSRDVPPVLVDTLCRLRRGEMDIRLGTAIGYISNVLLKAYEVADLEVRVEKLEQYAEENFDKE